MGNTVSVVNLANDKLTTSIFYSAGGLAGLAITPNGSYLYVAAQSKNCVVVMSTITNTVVGTVAVGSLASGRSACSLPMDFTRVATPAKRSGCWSSGRKKPRSPPGISSAICLPIMVFDAWCKSPKHAGRSSRTISNSRRNSGWITMRGAVGAAGTTM